MLSVEVKCFGAATAAVTGAASVIHVVLERTADAAETVATRTIQKALTSCLISNRIALVERL